VLYHGGQEFDSSWKRGEPATFSLSGVIPGWTQGIPGMRVGGRRELVIPASLAYGSKGQGTIPPNAPLVFVIDLLGA
jgi:peptidylprolyl isomerase